MPADQPPQIIVPVNTIPTFATPVRAVGPNIKQIDPYTVQITLPPKNED